MNIDEQKWIDEKFKSLHTLLEVYVKTGKDKNQMDLKVQERIIQKIDLVYDETKKTNGRIITIEKETVFMRFLEKKPLVPIFLLFALLVAMDLLNVGGQDILTMLKSIF